MVSKGTHRHFRASSSELGLKEKLSLFTPSSFGFELGFKERNPPTGDTQIRYYGVVPLMAGQVPVVVVSLRLSWQPCCTEKGGVWSLELGAVPLGVGFSPSSSVLSSQTSPLTSSHLQLSLGSGLAKRLLRSAASSFSSVSSTWPCEL